MRAVINCPTLLELSGRIRAAVATLTLDVTTYGLNLNARKISIGPLTVSPLNICKI
jgi:hypothetical protein